MKRKVNTKNRGVRANCGFCKYGGKVVNFMCSCSNSTLLNDYQRSVGYRKCAHFELDDSKYEQTLSN